MHDTVHTMIKPTDQKIVDDFFKLSTGIKTKSMAWLYGMVATYGIKPLHLHDFTWGPSNTILVKGRKRPIKPLHPHWLVIFDLKKQPRNVQDRIENLSYDLDQARIKDKIKCNVDDLLTAHKDRKKNFYDVKPTSTLFSQGPS